MLFEWDEAKRKQNNAKHGVDFDLVYEMDWANGLRLKDARHDYGEERFIIIALINGRLHVCTYTDRDGKRRIINLRKANLREIEFYEEETETSNE